MAANKRGSVPRRFSHLSSFSGIIKPQCGNISGLAAYRKAVCPRSCSTSLTFCRTLDGKVSDGGFFSHPFYMLTMWDLSNRFCFLIFWFFFLWPTNNSAQSWMALLCGGSVKVHYSQKNSDACGCWKCNGRVFVHLLVADRNSHMSSKTFVFRNNQELQCENKNRIGTYFQPLEKIQRDIWGVVATLWRTNLQLHQHLKLLFLLLLLMPQKMQQS